MKLTEEDFTTFDLDGEEYYQWSGSKEKMKQILENQENSDTIYREYYQKLHLTLQKNKELEQENKLLKEELSGCTKFAEGAIDGYDEVKSERDFFKNDCENLKQKLEKIKEFVDLHPRTLTATGLKELLDSQEKS